MKHLIRWTVAILGILALSAFAAPADATCYYSASTSQIDVDAAPEGGFSFEFDARSRWYCKWRASTSTPWIINLSPNHLVKGDGTVAFDVMENTGTEVLYGSIKIVNWRGHKVAEVTVTQGPAMAQEPECGFEVSQLDFAPEGGEATITASEGCGSWEATAGDVDWIEFTGQGGASSPTGFIVKQSADNEQRSVNLTIIETGGGGPGEMFSATVSQEAAEEPLPDCTIGVSQLTFPSEGGAADIEVSEGCASWEASIDDEIDWLTFTYDEESELGGPTGFTVGASCEDLERTVGITISETGLEGEGAIFSGEVSQSSPITPGAAASTSAAALYVTNPECQLIYEVTWNGASSVATVLASGLTQYSGLEYGPDELLYGSDPASGLFEINLPAEDNITGMFDPANARFNSDGDLVVATVDGLQTLDNQLDLIAQGVSFNPAQISTVANSASFGAFVDLTTAPNGDLLALAASGSVVRFPYLPASQSYGNGATLIPGISDPRAITRASTGKIVVADGDALELYRADGSSLGGCASFTGATVYGLEASADDYLYATVVDANGNGGLYEIPFDPATSTCGSPSLIATVNGVDGDPPPLAGVAVPFAGQIGAGLDPSDFAAGTQPFTFGEQVYEYRGVGDSGAPCIVELRSAEVSATSLDGLLNDSGIDATPIVYEGENGRAILFEYTEDGSGCTVDGPIVADEHGINAYFAATNPRVVLCHSDQDADNDPFTNPDCELTDALGSSAFGFLPDDGRTSGRGVGRFSWSFLVDKANFVGGEPVYDGTFCGPFPPLAFTSIEHPRKLFPYTILPIAFNVTENSCWHGPWVDDLTVVLGVNRLPLNGYTFRSIPFEELVFFGLTPIEPDRAVFRPLHFPWWGYQLNLKLKYADGTPFEPGAVFELTFTDESGLFFPNQTAYIEIVDY